MWTDSTGRSRPRARASGSPRARRALRERRLRVEPLEHALPLRRERVAAMRGHGRARDEFLAQRIDEHAGLTHPVVEVRAGGESGGSDAADDLTLSHPLAATDVHL